MDGSLLAVFTFISVFELPPEITRAILVSYGLRFN